MIRIAVCDDEMEDRDMLCCLLNMYQKRCSTGLNIRSFESGEQLLMSNLKPDIVFLNIVMKEEEEIGLSAEIKRKYPEVIIIYKIVLNNKILTAINQVTSFGYFVNREELYQLFFKTVALNKRNTEGDTITFHSEDHTKIELNANDIYYFEYFNRKIRIVAKDKTYICIKEKISNIAEKMEKYNFAMSHQSFVVNLNHVNRISSGLLIMENEDKVDLAQKRASAFRRKLRETVKNNVIRQFDISIHDI